MAAAAVARPGGGREDRAREWERDDDDRDQWALTDSDDNDEPSVDFEQIVGERAAEQCYE